MTVVSTSLLGDNVPHMRQLAWEVLPRRTAQGAQVVRVEGQDFFAGEANGDQNNCLIDTLRQQLGVVADLGAVRKELLKEFPRGPGCVTPLSFLELEHHWRHVVRLLGALAPHGSAFEPDALRIVCVDLAFPGHGAVEGDVAHTLYIARVRTNHFVPLRQCQ